MTGHLRSHSHKKVAHVAVILKSGEMHAGAYAVTDAKGNFEMNINTSLHDTAPLMFYYVDKHNDTVLLKEVTEITSETPEMTFWIK